MRIKSNRSIKANRNVSRGKNLTRRPMPRRKVRADEDIESEDIGYVNVAPEATELVFEASDVAELVAEVTGENVEVEADENEVTFTVGDTDYTVESEGNEEILESTKIRGRRRNRIAGSTNRPSRRPNRRPSKRPSRLK